MTIDIHVKRIVYRGDTRWISMDVFVGEGESRELLDSVTVTLGQGGDLEKLCKQLKEYYSNALKRAKDEAR